METIIEVNVTLTGTIVPYEPGRMFQPNGDPGYPEEGGYAEDLKILLQNPNPKLAPIDMTWLFPESEIDSLSEKYYRYMTEAREI